MFCHNCGNPYDDCLQYCPACSVANPEYAPQRISYGTQQNVNTNTSSYGTAQNTPYSQQTGADYAFSAAEPPKKKKKHFGKVFISLLLVVALVAGVCFIVPEITGTSSRYEKENIFYQYMKKADRKSDGRAVLEVFAALYNTVCNTKSFTLEFDSMEIKVVCGKDLMSSSVYIDPGIKHNGLVLRDGEFIYADTDSAYIFDMNIIPDIAPYFAERFEERLNNTKNALDSYEGDDELQIEMYNDYIEMYNNIISSEDKIVDSILNAVRNNNISFENIDYIYEMMLFPNHGYYPSYFDVGSFTNLFTLMADFLANGNVNDCFSVTETKTRDGFNTETKYKIRIKIDKLYEELAEYADTSSLWRETLGDDATDKFVRLFEENSDFANDADMVIEAVICNNRIKTFVFDNGYSEEEYEFSDINNTEVSESNYKRIKKYFDDHDNSYTFNSASDVIDYMEK